MRTYLPTLYKLLVLICVFITRHRATINRVIGVENVPKLDAYMVACDVLLEVIAPLVQPTT